MTMISYEIMCHKNAICFFPRRYETQDLSTPANMYTLYGSAKDQPRSTAWLVTKTTMHIARYQAHISDALPVGKP